MDGKKREHLRPLSMHPLTPEKAMEAFMVVNPRKVEKRIEKERPSNTKQRKED